LHERVSRARLCCFPEKRYLIHQREAAVLRLAVVILVASWSSIDASSALHGNRLWIRIILPEPLSGISTTLLSQLKDFIGSRFAVR
jgi:hypothetical protein